MIKMVVNNQDLPGTLYLDNSDQAGNPYIDTISATLDAHTHQLTFDYKNERVVYDWESQELDSRQFMEISNFFKQTFEIKQVKFNMVSFCLMVQDERIHNVHGLFPYKSFSAAAEIVLVGED